MRNRTGTTAVVVFSLITSLFPTGKAHACCADHTTYYDVREGCIITNYGHRIGQWWHLCNGQWVGWGVRPEEPCTDEIIEEQECL